MTSSHRRDVPVTAVLGSALCGVPCDMVGLGPVPMPIPVARWSGGVDASDRALLAHCAGPTLDVGCGPGRMSAHLALLLRRLHALLAPGGRAVVELAPYGAGLRTATVRLRTLAATSQPFLWSVVGAEVVAVLASLAGPRVLASHEYGGRSFAVLGKER